jgi:nitrite reductase/ring-hydroxylating ferredoxin subunit
MIPVSLSGGVEPGARTGTSVNGLPVVVWRGADGAVRAWPDQCPHRGMRLSFGFVRGNALVCIYHGWSFGTPDETDGDTSVSGPGGARAPGDVSCLAVPAHPGMTPPAKATIPELPVAEALGLIWVGTSPGDTRPPHPAALGLAEAVGGTLPVHPVRSVTVRAPASALRAAFESTPPPVAVTAETTALDDGGIVTFTGPALTLIAAIQDRGDGSATAHLVTTDAGAARRQELCEWAALVRDHLAAVVLP